MSFLDEVDSLKAKAGISKPRLPIVVGLGVIVAIILVLCAYLVWNSMSTPSFELSQTETSQPEEGAPEALSVQHVYVHVTGAVVSPGVYELTPDARVSDAINAAGGLRDDAVETSINLARVVTDGEQIVVASETEQAPANPSTPSENTSNPSTASNLSSSQALSKININTATAEELMELDGVGESTAQKIIAYRSDNGSFTSIEDIKNVSGIGDKKFEAIKDAITV